MKRTNRSRTVQDRGGTGGAIAMSSRRLLVLGLVLAVAACSSPGPSTPAAGSTAPAASAAPTAGSTAPASSAAPAASSSPAPSPASSGGPAGWRAFSPPDGSFEVLLPGSPTETKMRIPLASGSASSTTEIVMDPGGETGFLLSWIDYPDDAIAGKTPDALLAISQASVVANATGGVVASQQAIALGDHPGRAWAIAYTNGVIACRAYLVGSRMYLLEAVLALNEDPTAAETFFDSFTITP